MLTTFSLILITTVSIHAADFDEDAKATCMCFTHIFCDLKQYAMALDIIGDNEVAFKHFAFLIAKVARQHDINIDIERIKDRNAWEEYGLPVCKLSEKTKEKLCVDWLKNWTAIVSEVCAEEPEHCDDMCKPAETSFDIALEHYQRGDCTTIGENPFQLKGI
ncbi:hypothetical protein X975_16281, partial [Stegodyphus mimosarum]